MLNNSVYQFYFCLTTSLYSQHKKVLKILRYVIKLRVYVLFSYLLLTSNIRKHNDAEN